MTGLGEIGNPKNRGLFLHPSLAVSPEGVPIAMLGGYKARSCDGPPGWITLWRGLRRLEDMVEGYRLARPQPSRPPSHRHLLKKGAKIVGNPSPSGNGPTDEDPCFRITSSRWVASLPRLAPMGPKGLSMAPACP